MVIKALSVVHAGRAATHRAVDRLLLHQALEGEDPGCKGQVTDLLAKGSVIDLGDVD